MCGSRKKCCNVYHISHLHGNGAWHRELDDMMYSAAREVLVAEMVVQALVATATRRDSAAGSSGSAPIHVYCARLEKPEDWKERQHQFGVATHGCRAKNGALLEIVECMELDSVNGRKCSQRCPAY